MSKLIVKFVTVYPGMHYAIYLLVNPATGYGYIFSCWRGDLNHVCPCCLLAEHRRDIAVAINGLLPLVKRVYWLSPYRHASGKGFGEDASEFEEFMCCPVMFVTVLEDEFPFEIMDATAALK